MENENQNIESLKAKFSHIKGWAIDADPENEPNYPYKIYTGDDHKRLDWERPPLQEKTVEILHSTEHERTPAVFGTVVPPSGLSGTIRRKAFEYSENMLRRWLLLMFADRVNEVEGLMEDLKDRSLPHVWKEKGFDALWEHDKKELGQRALGTAIVVGAAVGLIAWMMHDKKEPVVASQSNLSGELSV
jgi:hypothetical protein